MNNSISSRWTQINKNARHTIKSLKTKQFLDTFVIFDYLLLKTVTEKYFQSATSYTDMQKLLNNVNFKLVEHLLNLLINMLVRTKRFLISLLMSSSSIRSSLIICRRHLNWESNISRNVYQDIRKFIVYLFKIFTWVGLSDVQLIYTTKLK